MYRRKPNGFWEWRWWAVRKAAGRPVGRKSRLSPDRRWKLWEGGTPLPRAGSKVEHRYWVRECKHSTRLAGRLSRQASTPDVETHTLHIAETSRHYCRVAVSPGPGLAVADVCLFRTRTRRGLCLPVPLLKLAACRCCARKLPPNLPIYSAGCVWLHPASAGSCHIAERS